MKKAVLISLSLFLTLPLGVFAQDELEEDDAVQSQVQRIRKTPKKTEATREISGRVVSQQDHAPLAGVLVQATAGEGYSALTDEDGAFTLKVPLYCSAVDVTIPGYNRVRVGLNKSGQLRDIIMQSDAAPALYADDENIMGHAVARGFDYSNAINVATEIENQLGAEVHTTERGGISGLGAYMQVGGVNSYMVNAQPLVVIDGVITEMQYGREMIHSGFYNDVLSNFNVNDIESVEVMKNGTALYGAKGANGVILIKTKRNRSLATRIDATASVGIELQPKHYDVLSGTQFKTYASSLLQTTGTKMQSFKFLDERPYNAADPYNYNYYYNKYANNTDWTSLKKLSPTSNVLEAAPRGEIMYKNFIKRLFDIVISLGVLVILSPVFLVTAVAIKLNSRGPVIFKQRRLGRDGKEFDIYKFRSMVQNAEHTRVDVARSRIARFVVL